MFLLFLFCSVYPTLSTYHRGSFIGAGRQLNFQLLCNVIQIKFSEWFASLSVERSVKRLPINGFKSLTWNHLSVPRMRFPVIEPKSRFGDRHTPRRFCGEV